MIVHSFYVNKSMNLNTVVSPIRVINNCKSGSSARMVTTDGEYTMVTLFQ